MIGNARLVTGNLFGGVFHQIAVLAIVDAVAVRGALTWFTPQPVLLFQGVMLLLLPSLALAGAALGEPLSLLGLGLTPAPLASGYVLTVWGSQRTDYLPPLASHCRTRPRRGGRGRQRSRFGGAQPLERPPVLVLGRRRAGHPGDRLDPGQHRRCARRTDRSGRHVRRRHARGLQHVPSGAEHDDRRRPAGPPRDGSLEHPRQELSRGGTLLLADVVYRGGPLLAVADSGAVFAAAMGMVVTTILLLGLLERRDRTIMGMGLDSLSVLIAYAAGLGGLYYLR